MHDRLKQFRRFPGSVELNRLAGGKKFNSDDPGNVISNVTQFPGRKSSHGYMVFLVGGSGKAIDTGRVRQRLVLRRKCRSGYLRRHEP